MIGNAAYPLISITASLSNGILLVSNISNGALSSGLMVGGLNVPPNLFLGQQISGVPGGPGQYPVFCYGVGSSGFPTPSIQATLQTTLPIQPMVVAPWSLNIEQTIVSQYANSPVLLSMINNMNAFIDPQANLFNFYNQIWNVNTATGYGLDLWGRIVGVSRVVQLPGIVNGVSNIWFREAEGLSTSTITPFGPGGTFTFYNGQNQTTSYTLSDAAFRAVILAKALSNISVCSAQSLNQLLQNMLGPGIAFVNDLGNMQMQVTFYGVSLLNYYLLLNARVLPRPCGVTAYIYNAYVVGSMFTFREAGSLVPMGYGAFFNGQYNAVQY